MVRTYPGNKGWGAQPIETTVAVKCLRESGDGDAAARNHRQPFLANELYTPADIFHRIRRRL